MAQRNLAVIGGQKRKAKSAAQQSLGLPVRLVTSARAATDGIHALLKQLAPLQA